MKRREFIHNTTVAAAMPLMLGGFTLAKGSPAVDKFAKLAGNNNRVLVLINLAGGNDGLNTLVPLDQYDNLAAVRNNILVPKNTLLNLNVNSALNPAMSEMFNLYKTGKMGLVQNVGYPNPNFSHFRSTDIWTSASDSDKVLNDGWLGRYLASDNPDYMNYPDATHTDPMSITVGSLVSATCQGPVYNMGIAVTTTVEAEMYFLLAGNPDTTPDTYAGTQIKFLRDEIVKTQKYTTSILAAAKIGKNLSTKYAAKVKNKFSLSDQLKIVAQLINGGLQTKIYVCSLGGFDTHYNQVQDSSSPLGMHYSLLQELSNAIGAFQDDLKLMGIEDRVAGMTFSEFGRRVISNESKGTDHGAAAPLFVFGSQVNPMVHGSSPIINPKATVDDNVPMQFDFRSVYASILKEWLEVPDSIIQSDILYKDYQYLPLFKATSVETQDYLNNENVTIESIYPNPIYSNGKVKIKLIDGWSEMSIYDVNGLKVTSILDRNMIEGEYELDLNANNLNSGTYYLKLQNKGYSKVSGFSVVK